MNDDTLSMDPVFVRETLLTLFRQIQEYCVSGRRRIASANCARKTGETKRYIENGLCLTKQLDTLIEMAQGVDLLPAERLEAMAAEAHAFQKLVTGAALRGFGVQN